MSKMEVVVGTYDEVLLGFRIVEVGKAYQIETSFTDRSHAGCVKTVAISNKGILASGSTDESIRLLNLKKQKELGSLLHHSGTITSLEFHKGFLFSTSEDGKLCLWKSFTWECLRTFKGHKSAVNFVSVHPSGKLALTVGADRSMHTWNLITGRSAYITNIKQVADLVKWSPDGDKYLIVFNNRIDVYSVATAEIITSIQAEGRINCLDFYDETVCVYGGEGGCIYMHNIETNSTLHKLDTNTVRVKGLCLTPSLKENEKCKKWLCMCSSDGHIKVYKVIESEDKFDTDLVTEYTTGFRLTCLAVYNRDRGSHTEEEECESETVDISENTDTGKDTDKIDRNTNKINKKKKKGGKAAKRQIHVDTEPYEERDSGSTEKVKEKKNRKRKGSMKNVNAVDSVDTEIHKPKKLKKCTNVEKNLEHGQKQKTKMDKINTVREITGEEKPARLKSKNKKKNKKKKIEMPVE